MFSFIFLAGLCTLTFPLMGIKDFKKEKRSTQAARSVFILLGVIFIIGGVIDLNLWNVSLSLTAFYY
ncbi:hypothetical protein SAMN04487936_103344 [Halobacillus dabanensis]|uniref:Uncharacterized protein n=1 Tax=Halobacillus dabanensis TaxID=240302 RepID=A0A1I3TDC3_HALDA|nr:hypothetical protein SAMN04487936_103344 [Halobacillus dabanensis]